MARVNQVGTSTPRAGGEGATPRLVAGRYRLGALLGAGGEGDTFSALDETTGQTHALKLFRATGASAVARVRFEFERLRAVEHPGLVRAVAVGRDGDHPYLVTALLAGASIAAIAEVADDERRRTAFTRAARQVTDALGYLHGRGVVHGDVSPDNVRLDPDGGAVLIDLGVAALAGTNGGAAIGTLGFAAPEALVGQVCPTSDLFSLGATLFLAWTGTAPFGVGGAAAARMLSTPAARISAVRGGLAPGWEALIDSLLQLAPERRPSSARAVLREIARLAGEEADTSAMALPPFPGGDPLAGTFVGRAPERATIAKFFEALGDGACSHAAVVCAGPAGSGRTSLLEIALQDLAIAQMGESAAPVATFRGTLADLGRWLSSGDDTPVPDEDPVRRRERRFARLAAAAERRAAERPLAVVLSAGAEELAFATFVAGAQPSGRWAVLLPGLRPLERAFALDLILAPLTQVDIALLATRASGEDAPADAVERIAVASGGHAATVAVLVRQLVEAIRQGEGHRFQPHADTALDALLTAAFAALETPVRVAVASQLLGLGPAPDDPATAETARVLERARAAGWMSGEGSDRRPPSAAHERVVRSALGAADLRHVVELGLHRLPDNDGRRGICLEALGREHEAAAAYLDAATTAVVNAASTDPRVPDETVIGWLREAARLAPQSLDTEQRLILGTALAMGGEYAAAEAVLTAAGGEAVRAAGARLRIDERRSWVKSRAGDLGAATELLERALSETATTATARDAALPRVRLARLLVSSGQFEAAIASAAPFADDGVAGALALETLVLAHVYTGDAATARSLLSSSGALPPARSAYLAAFVEHLAGQLSPALDGYRQALPAADQAGDVHTVAAIALNLAALAAEAGQYGEALTIQDRAIRELGRLAAAELATALFNGAMLLIELGDATAARALLARARREATGRPAATASVTYLEAELSSRAGDEDAALRLFSAVGAAPGVDPGLRAAADLARVELLGRRERHAEAGQLLDARSAAENGPRAAADVRLGRARLLLAAPALDVDAAVRVARTVAEDAAQAVREGRRPRAWRAYLTAARLFHRAGQSPDAASALASARAVFEEIRMATPTEHHSGLEQDRDARFLMDLARLGAGNSADPASTARAARSARVEDRLRRLLRINKRLNSELRLPRLLELIMDTVVELTEAERGFLLLEDDKGELTVKVARNFDQQTLETGAFELSRSIARQAATGGAPIVTLDAAGDPRFREALSVSDLHLRSVLAVPLQVKGRSAGTIYVDNRLRRGAFGDDDVQLLLDFAEQAGIAIENARLMSELRRRERQIEVLNRRLEGELAIRKEELSGIKQELRENREALAIRYDYRNIVGRTPRMLELFRLLDRLTDTLLPVVIQGESGTGKELVARALHFNGPRKDRPFVSENCAAIPETLLESTLFGAVRGAYTGADHDSRGLFEVADGGTLFLDEVGEMSAGMQGKLLRVLQTGELRRVGSERMRKVDVRIIAATNRDLGRMVEQGRFRQDLFFRLSVAPIALPPLRERREDIPAIVAHVLEKLAAATNPPGLKDKAPVPRRVEPAAMSRLAAYRWPGNVRELENELMRAAALSDDRIHVSDLSPHVAGDAEATLTTLDDPDSLALKPRVERLERALVREALARTGGNQTRAADALGLSRFGLQKKMQRYQIT